MTRTAQTGVLWCLWFGDLILDVQISSTRYEGLKLMLWRANPGTRYLNSRHWYGYAREQLRPRPGAVCFIPPSPIIEPAPTRGQLPLFP